MTHLCIAAHHDDIETMAYAGIVDRLDHPGRAFGGVIMRLHGDAVARLRTFA